MAFPFNTNTNQNETIDEQSINNNFAPPPIPNAEMQVGSRNPGIPSQFPFGTSPQQVTQQEAEIVNGNSLENIHPECEVDYSQIETNDMIKNEGPINGLNTAIFNDVFTDQKITSQNGLNTAIVNDVFEDQKILSTDIITEPVEEFENFQTQQKIIPQQNKYTIVDLFWLINPKQNYHQNEAQFVSLQFNVNFGNLRIVFYKLGQNSIVNDVIFINNMEKLKNGVIYPASAINIVKTPEITQGLTCVDQLYNYDQNLEWQTNRPSCIIQKNKDTIRCTLREKSNNNDFVFYDFKNWQKDAFLYACQFVVTNGMQIYTQYQINK